MVERYFEYPQNARTFGIAVCSVQTASVSSTVVGNPEGLGFMNESANYSAVTLGTGVSFSMTSDYIRAVNLDYSAAYRAIADGDWQHVVSVTIPFGLCDMSLPDTETQYATIRSQ